MHSHFAELSQLSQGEQPGRVVERLIEILRGSGNYHQLFDASLLQKKLALGIVPIDPSGFEDVPELQRSEFETFYIDTAPAGWATAARRRKSCRRLGLFSDDS